MRMESPYLFLIRMDYTPRKLQSKLMKILTHKCKFASLFLGFPKLFRQRGGRRRDYLKVWGNFFVEILFFWWKEEGKPTPPHLPSTLSWIQLIKIYLTFPLKNFLLSFLKFLFPFVLFGARWLNVLVIVLYKRASLAKAQRSDANHISRNPTTVKILLIRLCVVKMMHLCFCEKLVTWKHMNISIWFEL